MIPDTWSIELDESTGVPVVTVQDELRVDDFVRFLSEMRNVPAYWNSTNVLWDLRQTVKVPSAKGIRLLAQYIKSEAKLHHRLAIVVERDDHFGMSRMFEILIEQPGIERRVFRDYDEAWEWLLVSNKT